MGAALQVAIWVNRTQRLIPRALLGGFFDDTNGLVDTADELDTMLEETLRIDDLTHSVTHTGKTGAYSVDRSMEKELQWTTIAEDQPIKILTGDKLLGVQTTVSNTWDRSVQDERAAKVTETAKRIRCAPQDDDARAFLVAATAARQLAPGLELCGPTAKAKHL